MIKNQSSGWDSYGEIRWLSRLMASIGPHPGATALYGTSVVSWEIFSSGGIIITHGVMEKQTPPLGLTSFVLVLFAKQSP